MTIENTIAINDLDQFVKLLSQWHSHKIKIIKHMQEAPETTEVAVGDEKPVPLTGDFRKGFQLGIAVALAEMGELPFVAELEEAITSVKH